MNLGAQSSGQAPVQQSGNSQGNHEANFSQAGRGVLTQSVRPTVCDVEEEEQEDSEWWNKWHKPFNPGEESTKEEDGQSEKEEKPREREPMTNRRRRRRRRPSGHPVNRQRRRSTSIWPRTFPSDRGVLIASGVSQKVNRIKGHEKRTERYRL